MEKQTRKGSRTGLYIIGSIARKDIADAFNSKLVISIIIMGSIILLFPKMIPLILEQPALGLPMLIEGDPSLITGLQDDPNVSIQEVRSEDELGSALCNAMYPKIGLLIPDDFDQLMAADGEIGIPGYVCWSRRFQVASLEPKLEGILSQSLGRTVDIHIEGNIVYPSEDGGLYFSLAVVNAIIVIITMGITLVPSLIFEEKQTRTMQALLVSPASIGQVVAGKAVAGFFFIVVTSMVVYAISWVDVVHWSVVALFTMLSGIFLVSVGLVLGSFYEKQQDAAGWTIVLIVALIGAILAKTIDLNLPPVVQGILPWIPSVALSEIYRASFAENMSLVKIGFNTLIVLFLSLPLYGLVIWKVRRSDR